MSKSSGGRWERRGGSAGERLIDVNSAMHNMHVDRGVARAPVRSDGDR